MSPTPGGHAVGGPEAASLDARISLPAMRALEAAFQVAQGYGRPAIGLLDLWAGVADVAGHWPDCGAAVALRAVGCAPAVLRDATGGTPPARPPYPIGSLAQLPFEPAARELLARVLLEPARGLPGTGELLDALVYETRVRDEPLPAGLGAAALAQAIRAHPVEEPSAAPNGAALCRGLGALAASLGAGLATVGLLSGTPPGLLSHDPDGRILRVLSMTGLGCVGLVACHVWDEALRERPSPPSRRIAALGIGASLALSISAVVELVLAWDVLLVQPDTQRALLIVSGATFALFGTGLMAIFGGRRTTQGR